MIEQKHTQEPWSLCEVENNTGRIKHLVPVDSEKLSILTLVENDQATFAAIYKDADARRIVACVNACAGIPTELLEDSKCWAEAGIETATSLRKQRDDLLAALQSISNITGDAGFNIGGPLEHCPGEIDHDEAKRLLSLACEYIKDTSKTAHRAIASMKGGAE